MGSDVEDLDLEDDDDDLLGDEDTNDLVF